MEANDHSILNQHYRTFNVSIEHSLRKYLPEMFKLIGRQKIGWNKLDKRLNQILEKRVIKFYEQGKYLKVRTNFYDLVVQALEGKAEALRFLTYVNEVIKSLNENLTTYEKEMVCTPFRNMLSNMTKNYLHSLGELFYIEKIMRSKNCRLLKVEYKLPNGKDIDFQFQFKDTGKKILVEIRSVELEGQDLDTDENIQRLIHNKYEEKIEEKMNSRSSPLTFWLVLVLWGSADELKKVAKFYNAGRLEQIDKVIEPVAYCCWASDDINCNS